MDKVKGTSGSSKSNSAGATFFYRNLQLTGVWWSLSGSEEIRILWIKNQMEVDSSLCIYYLELHFMTLTFMSRRLLCSFSVHKRTDRGILGKLNIAAIHH